MRKRRVIILYLFISLFILNLNANESEWKILSGDWDISGHQIVPLVNNNPTERYTILNTSSGKDISWEHLSVDFKYATDCEQVQAGIMLNVENADDYQLLRITQGEKQARIQMLHWKYGYFRMWQEILLSENLDKEILYNISIIKAPAVDKEDWRPWKILIKEKSTGNVILKQGIENEIPAFGLGQVGLYSTSPSIIFSDFQLDAKDRKGSLVLPSIFSDGMILQHYNVNPVWGKAAPDCNIVVKIAGAEYKTHADKQGKWIVNIPPIPVSRNMEMHILAGKDSTIIKNIAFGEVWLASGQSNMEMRVWQTDVSNIVSGKSADNNLRIFRQPQWPSENPVFSSGGEWQEADSSNIMGWSAVAYRFGTELRKKLNIPVGIISSYWGGTAIESWFSRDELARDSITMSILKRYNESLINLERGLPTENKFPWCWDVAGQRHAPGNLYNGMIFPLIPYSIKGVIWYQGESNTEKARQYGHLFPLLIDSWRKNWNNPDLSFFFVQLAGYDGKESGSNIDSAWPQLRDIQRRVQDKREKTGMVVAFHLGDSLDIHPYKKNEIGLRLANLALHDTYNFEEIICRGPLFEQVIFEEDTAIITFKEIASGLQTRDAKPLSGFSIAGENGIFHPAIAVITDDRSSVTVHSNKVRKPVAVRYGWTNYSLSPNLINSANLPASPFRTDNWELPTDRNL